MDLVNLLSDLHSNTMGDRLRPAAPVCAHRLEEYSFGFGGELVTIFLGCGKAYSSTSCPTALQAAWHVLLHPYSRPVISGLSATT